MSKLIDRFALGIAPWKGRDLSPKTAIRLFMDDDGVMLHASILPQTVKATISRTEDLGWGCTCIHRTSTPQRHTLPYHG
jgi:hypothetical protein